MSLSGIQYDLFSLLCCTEIIVMKYCYCLPAKQEEIIAYSETQDGKKVQRGREE
jgi:hypothetical protein